jgi:aminoglycoside 6'-N-acetyltransferase
MDRVTELRGERVVLRPMEPDDAPRLREILTTPEVARWWGAEPEGFPAHDDPGATRFALLVDGEVAGLVQWDEEKEPDYRHAWIDLFLDPRLHGRGVGTDAVATLARHLLDEQGHHRITIDPAAENAAAIRSYEKAGFRQVGVMRSAWRNPEGVWRDALLMELVRSPRTS